MYALDSSVKHGQKAQPNKTFSCPCSRSRTSYCRALLKVYLCISTRKFLWLYWSWNTHLCWAYAQRESDQAVKWQSIPKYRIRLKGWENGRESILYVKIRYFCRCNFAEIYAYSPQQGQTTWKCCSAHYKSFYNSTNVRNGAAWGACYCYYCRLKEGGRKRSYRQVERMTRGMELLLSKGWLHEIELFKLKKGHLFGVYKPSCATEKEAGEQLITVLQNKNWKGSS